MFRLTIGGSVDRRRSKAGNTAFAAVFVLLMLAALPVVAHHSFAAQYDSNKPITLKGRLTKMEWVNPHSSILVDVAGVDGNVVMWRCEAAPPNVLYRAGWRKDSLKPGDEIVVKGFLAKDGTPTIWMKTVTTAGARTLAGHADQIQ